jgi:hypothetical protein
MLLPEIFVAALLWVMAKRDVVVFLRTLFSPGHFWAFLPVNLVLA